MIYLACLLCAAPPAVPAPALVPGDELVYAGDVLEVSERADLPYRRRALLEVRLFCLATGRGTADVAVLTLTRAQDDPHVVAAVKVVSGTTPAGRDGPPAVTLDLIRLDARGRVTVLNPSPVVPLALSAKTPTAVRTPRGELSMFAPLPDELPAVGTTWTAGDAAWAAKAVAVWAGAQVVELAGAAQSPTWDRPMLGKPGTRRADRVWVSPSDGLARVVERTVETKDGPTRVGTTTTHLEMKPPTPHRGESFARMRREVEHAVMFHALAATPGEALAARIERYAAAADATGFRPAIDAALRKARPPK